MEHMTKRAILTLLVGALFSSMGVPTPSLAVINEAGPSGVAPQSGWMVWYEDETFEDCGGALTSDLCTDTWQPALPRFIATEEQCRSTAFDYNRKAREEFQCAHVKPADKVDDLTTHP